MSLIITVMVINMQEERLDSIESLEPFLAGIAGVSPMVAGRESGRQAYVQRVLSHYGYSGLSRRDKGVVVRYVGRDEVIVEYLAVLYDAHGTTASPCDNVKG